MGQHLNKGFGRRLFSGQEMELKLGHFVVGKGVGEKCAWAGAGGGVNLVEGETDGCFGLGLI